MRLFPEIGLEETKFPQVRREYTQTTKYLQQVYTVGGYWKDIKNRRNIFIKFAQKHNFDPLAADNWYDIKMNAFNGMQKV